MNQLVTQTESIGYSQVSIGKHRGVQPVSAASFFDDFWIVGANGHDLQFALFEFVFDLSPSP
jgi:hypothetical protein